MKNNLRKKLPQNHFTKMDNKFFVGTFTIMLVRWWKF